MRSPPCTPPPGLAGSTPGWRGLAGAGGRTRPLGPPPGPCARRRPGPRRSFQLFKTTFWGSQAHVLGRRVCVWGGKGRVFPGGWGGKEGGTGAPVRAGRAEAAGGACRALGGRARGRGGPGAGAAGGGGRARGEAGVARPRAGHTPWGPRGARAAGAGGGPAGGALDAATPASGPDQSVPAFAFAFAFAFARAPGRTHTETQRRERWWRLDFLLIARS